MAIEYVGVSANVAAASGNITITPPATQTDDIMICAVSTHDNVALSFPANWTIYQQANNGTGLRATLAWKRCVGAEGAFAVTHTAGDGIVGNVIVFRGCINNGSPINASVLTNNASSSTCTAATITSTVAGCMLLFTMHDADNGASSSQSSANLGSMTERFDNASTLGLDQAVSGAHVLQGALGASGASTGTLSLGPDINSGGNTFLTPGPQRLFPPQRPQVGATFEGAEREGALLMRPQHLRFPFYITPPEATANPVIALRVGRESAEWSAESDLRARPQIFYVPSPEFAPAAQMLARVQVVALPPAVPDVPIAPSFGRIGASPQPLDHTAPIAFLISRLPPVDDVLSTRPQFLRVLSQEPIQPASPVLAPIVVRAIEREEERTLQPVFFAMPANPPPPLPANPVIPWRYGQQPAPGFTLRELAARPIYLYVPGPEYIPPIAVGAVRARALWADHPLAEIEAVDSIACGLEVAPTVGCGVNLLS